MAYSLFFIVLAVVAGCAKAQDLDDHYSDIYQMILRGQNSHSQHQVKRILLNEMLTRQERNEKLRRWAGENRAEDTLKWFLEKEREYENHNMQFQSRRPHDISRTSRKIRKIAKCPHTSEWEKIHEVPDEIKGYNDEQRFILQTLYPSLNQSPLDLPALRDELEAAPFQEIEDKNSAMLEIAYSYDKSPSEKKHLIETEIQQSSNGIATVLEMIWTRIPGVHPVSLKRRRRRSHPKDLV